LSRWGMHGVEAKRLTPQCTISGGSRGKGEIGSNEDWGA
jgi:hypothetical protein